MGHLDTRGFVDGALRGFDVMDRYMTRREQAERQQRRDAENDRRYNAEQAYRKTRDDESDSRYESEQERLRAIDALNEKQVNASLRASEAQTDANTTASELNEWQINREKRLAYLKDEGPILQAAWDKFEQSGELDPIFDNEHVKGSAYDPRRYTTEHFKAVKQLETAIPQLAEGKLAGDAPEIVQPLSVFYAENIKTGIGDKDPQTGKVIADKQLLAVNPVHDVDPKTPGDQPGLVLTLDVIYDDGSKMPKPVTTNRGTEPNESVMVVPLKKAMADLTGQMQLAKKASTRLFTNQDHAREDVNDFRAAMLENDKWFATESAKIDNNLTIQNKQGAKTELYNQYQQRSDKIKQMFGQQNVSKEAQPKTELNIPQWVGNDPQKLEFFQFMAKERWDLNNITQEQIDTSYQYWLRKRQRKEADLVAGGIVDKETAARLAQN